MTAAHSEAMSKRLLKLDYVGIAFGICATNMSSTYFGLHDKPWWLMFYNTFCVIAGVALLVSLMSPNADGPKAALVRYALFSHPRLCKSSAARTPLRHGCRHGG